MMAKKTALNRLDVARAALDATTKQIGELEARRNTTLLADDDDTAARLLGELEALRAVAHGHTDKITLLEAEAEREKAAAIVRSHKGLIDRFARMLAGSDVNLAEAADLIAQAWKKIGSGIDKREKARAAFSVRSSHARAAAESIEGCAMSAAAVMALLSYEFYRISAKPLLGGVPGARTRPHLPGAKPPSLSIALQPEKITPFAEKLRTASAFAVKTLREEIGSGGDVAEVPAIEQPKPTNGDAAQRTPEQNTLVDLLRRADELASDITPEGEQKYQAIVAQIPAAEAAANASIARTK